MDTYTKTQRIIEPKRKRLVEAESSAFQATSTLQAMISRLKTAEEESNKIQEEYEKTIQLRSEMQNEIHRIRVRQANTNSVIKILSRERSQWNERLSCAEKQLIISPYEVALGAAILCYAVALPLTLRFNLMECWIDLLKLEPGVHEIRESYMKIDCWWPIPKYLDIGLDLKRDWAACGLGSDTKSQQNAFAVYYSRRWPLLIDPQGLGSKWIRQMERENGVQVLVVGKGPLSVPLLRSIRRKQPQVEPLWTPSTNFEHLSSFSHQNTCPNPENKDLQNESNQYVVGTHRRSFTFLQGKDQECVSKREQDLSLKTKNDENEDVLSLADVESDSEEFPCIELLLGEKDKVKQRAYSTNWSAHNHPLIGGLEESILWGKPALIEFRCFDSTPTSTFATLWGPQVEKVLEYTGKRVFQDNDEQIDIPIDDTTINCDPDFRLYISLRQSGEAATAALSCLPISHVFTIIDFSPSAEQVKDILSSKILKCLAPEIKHELASLNATFGEEVEEHKCQTEQMLTLCGSLEPDMLTDDVLLSSISDIEKTWNKSCVKIDKVACKLRALQHRVDFAIGPLLKKATGLVLATTILGRVLSQHCSWNFEDVLRIVLSEVKKQHDVCCSSEIASALQSNSEIQDKFNGTNKRSSVNEIIQFNSDSFDEEAKIWNILAHVAIQSIEPITRSLCHIFCQSLSTKESILALFVASSLVDCPKLADGHPSMWIHLLCLCGREWGKEDINNIGSMSGSDASFALSSLFGNVTTVNEKMLISQLKHNVPLDSGSVMGLCGVSTSTPNALKTHGMSDELPYLSRTTVAAALSSGRVEYPLLLSACSILGFPSIVAAMPPNPIKSAIIDSLQSGVQTITIISSPDAQVSIVDQIRCASKQLIPQGQDFHILDCQTEHISPSKLYSLMTRLSLNGDWLVLGGIGEDSSLSCVVSDWICNNLLTNAPHYGDTPAQTEEFQHNTQNSTPVMFRQTSRKSTRKLKEFRPQSPNRASPTPNNNSWAPFHASTGPTSSFRLFIILDEMYLPGKCTSLTSTQLLQPTENWAHTEFSSLYLDQNFLLNTNQPHSLESSIIDETRKEIPTSASLYQGSEGIPEISPLYLDKKEEHERTRLENQQESFFLILSCSLVVRPRNAEENCLVVQRLLYYYQCYLRHFNDCEDIQSNLYEEKQNLYCGPSFSSEVRELIHNQIGLSLSWGFVCGIERVSKCAMFISNSTQNMSWSFTSWLSVWMNIIIVLYRVVEHFINTRSEWLHIREDLLLPEISRIVEESYSFVVSSSLLSILYDSIPCRLITRIQDCVILNPGKVEIPANILNTIDRLMLHLLHNCVTSSSSEEDWTSIMLKEPSQSTQSTFVDQILHLMNVTGFGGYGVNIALPPSDLVQSKIVNHSIDLFIEKSESIPHNDGSYAIDGKVAESMDVVKRAMAKCPKQLGAVVFILKKLLEKDSLVNEKEKLRTWFCLRKLDALQDSRIANTVFYSTIGSNPNFISSYSIFSSLAHEINKYTNWDALVCENYASTMEIQVDRRFDVVVINLNCLYDCLSIDIVIREWKREVEKNFNCSSAAMSLRVAMIDETQEQFLKSRSFLSGVPRLIIKYWVEICSLRCIRFKLKKYSMVIFAMAALHDTTFGKWENELLNSMLSIPLEKEHLQSTPVFICIPSVHKHNSQSNSILSLTVPMASLLESSISVQSGPEDSKVIIKDINNSTTYSNGGARNIFKTDDTLNKSLRVFTPWYSFSYLN